MFDSSTIFLMLGFILIAWTNASKIQSHIGISKHSFEHACVNRLNLCPRGGDGYMSPDEGYDEYDDYDDLDDFEEYDEEVIYQSRKPKPRSRLNDKDRRDPRNLNDNARRPPHKRKRVPNNSSASSAINIAFNAAKKTADLATTTAVSSIKGSTRAAVHLASPKYVSRNDIIGVWRFDQQVGSMPDGPFTSCAANIEFTLKGETITIYNKKEMVSTFLFVERSWPRSCTIEFEANAFQGPDDKVPVKMLYRGYFRRKIAKRSVIKIEGKMYSISGRGSLFSRKREVLVGSFTARKRIDAKQVYQDEDIDDFYDGEYDDYDDFNEGYDQDEETEYDNEEY